MNQKQVDEFVAETDQDFSDMVKMSGLSPAQYATTIGANNLAEWSNAAKAAHRKGFKFPLVPSCLSCAMEK